MTKLGTTTWRNRNYDRLLRVKEQSIDLGISRPIIIDIGPGGLVDCLFNYFPAGKHEEWTSQERLVRGIIKLIESPLRKTNLFYLETSETQEIVQIFKDLQPEVIYVIDREQKVIDAVKRIVDKDNFSLSFDYALIDISTQQIPRKGNIVIAYNVIERASNYQKSLENIANSVDKGGLLSISPNRDILGFIKIGQGLYLKEK